MANKAYKSPKNDEVTVLPADPKLHEEAMEERDRPLRETQATLGKQTQKQRKLAQIEAYENIAKICQEKAAVLRVEINDA